MTEPRAEPASLRVAMTLEQCWHRVPGGTTVATLGAATALASRADLEVVGVAAWHRTEAIEAWRPPVPVTHLPLPRLALYESWHRLRRPRVQTATGPVDVIHATAMPIPPPSAPLVVTIHDLAFLRSADHFTRRGNSFFRRGLELALRDADLVLCPSKATIGDCIEAGFPAAKLRLVPHGVTVQNPTPDEVARVRRHHGLDRPYVLWTGTVEPRKNLAGLLSAWAMVDAEADLVLVGPAGWNTDLEALLRGAGSAGPQSKRGAGSAEPRVKVLGFLPHRDLAPIYAGAEVFCYPSFTEGFGLPVLEAMAQSTPVVTSLGTSTEEIGGDATILVDPADPAAIAEGIARILGDAELGSRLASKGRARAATYTWEVAAELTLAAYREVAWPR
ncbi:MAG: glycosyltransferase family 4 protein [Actinomycetota bacterium]|nr:glycosyltransferase family 4 protein [Actinomycetota bacterium]